MTIGVIGTGRIGTAVVDRLRGFGCPILAYDCRPTTSARHVPLDELLRRSDIVTLHTPLNADTHHLLSRRRIEQMKDGAFIINTGRGALLDTTPFWTPWRVADSAARRWMSSKARKDSSTPTAGSDPLNINCCCGCTSCRTSSSRRTPPTTPTTPCETSSRTRSATASASGDDRHGSAEPGRPLRRVLRRTPHLGQVRSGGGEVPRPRTDTSPTTSGSPSGAPGSCATARARIGRPVAVVRPCSHRTPACTDCWSRSGGGTGPSGVDVVLPVLHGRLGEDGAIQGLLELSSIPYVGCDVQSSALCMDKSLAYLVARSVCVATPDFWTVGLGQHVDPDGLPYPVFVKPARSGSSFGVSKVARREELTRCSGRGAPVRLESADRRVRPRRRSRMCHPRERHRAGRRRARPRCRSPMGSSESIRSVSPSGVRRTQHSSFPPIFRPRRVSLYGRRPRPSIAPWDAEGWPE